jgi:hypothetical protein
LFFVPGLWFLVLVGLGNNAAGQCLSRSGI